MIKLDGISYLDDCTLIKRGFEMTEEPKKRAVKSGLIKDGLKNLREE